MITSKKQFDSIIEKAMKASDKFSIEKESLFELACIFENGLFEGDKTLIEIDMAKSYYWYNQAMINGDVNAKVRIADFLSEGIECKKDINKAISLYLSCVEKGLSIAAFNLATIYRDQHEYNEAFKYYDLGEQLMSKEYGKKTYSLSVTMCYLYGIGVPKDFEKALARLECFVDHENNYSYQYDIDEANFILGTLYLQGTEIPQNIDKARSFLLKADEDQDHRPAQEMLLLIGRK